MSSARSPAGSSPWSSPASTRALPQRLRALGGHPELVAEIARVARAGHGHRTASGARANFSGREVEVAHRAEVNARRGRLSNGPSPRPLERQHADLFRDVPHLDVHAPAAVLEPAQAGLRRADQKALAREALHVAVLQQMALLVAPGRVHHPARATLREVPRHEAIQQPFGVRAGDLVLEQRRHVDQAGRVADRPVLAFGRRLVGFDARVARPVTPRSALAQRGRPPVERRPQGFERSQTVVAR